MLSTTREAQTSKTNRYNFTERVPYGQGKTNFSQHNAIYKEDIDMNILKYIGYFGLLYFIGSGMLLMAIWFTAFLSPDYTVVVTINTIGEAWIELVVNVLGIIGLVIFIKQTYGGKENEYQ